MDRKEIYQYFLKRGQLLSPEVLDKMTALGDISKFGTEDIVIEHRPERDFEIITSYADRCSKNTLSEFVDYFKRRYNLMLGVLRTHQELADVTSISRTRQMNPGEKVSIVGMIVDKSTTKNNHIILKVEDPYSQISVLIRNDKDRTGSDELYQQAKELCLDEIVGICGVVGGKDIIYANSLIWPDIPLSREMKKSPKDEYAVFIGDLHLGSKAFLKKEFENFIQWLGGRVGSEEQMRTARKIRYIFIVGDLVDGAGIYPDQEEDLLIKDITEQYNELASYLSRFPRSAQIFLCPGNHDAVRLSEPQPPLYTDFAKAVYDIPNVSVLSNPSVVKISIGSSFSGLDVLMYHGYSYPFYGDSVESIRMKGGLIHTDLISNYLLKRRHLAPAHGSSLYMPNYEKDPLFIDPVPDFFITGHIHRSSCSNYRSVTCINSSCWISQTKYQEKVGLKPQPGRVALVNLQTRKAKILKFAGD